MTVAKALAKADAALDSLSADALLACEDRHRSATDEEVAAEISRLSAAHAVERLRLHAWCGCK